MTKTISLMPRAALILALVPAVLSAQVEDKTVYEAAVGPVIAARCGYCHGADKQKGELRLDSPEAWSKAGESGKTAIVAGKSAESHALALSSLPADDDDHMPPKNKPQPTADELEVLKWWVDAGAKTDVKIKDAGLPDPLKAKVLAIAATPPQPPPATPTAPAGTGKPMVDPKDATVLQVEKDLGVTIVPLAQNDPGLSFTCVNIADKFGDAELAQLAPIAVKLTDVNLARSKITDAGLATIAGMTEVRRLRLENTALTDAGIDHLTGLQNLEYLNLFNTKITDAGLAKLEKLTKLKRLYVWQTGVTEDAAKALHSKLPEIVINLGWDKEVKTVVAAPPPPPAPAAPAPAAMDPEQTAYVGLIAPIFSSKCNGCHGAEKQKGKLRTDSLEAVLKGGESDTEKSVVPGKSAESLIVKRIQLPHDNDDHMPPKDKDQLNEKELKLLMWWIDNGAKGDVKIKDAGIPAELLK